jgi:protein TonB
MTDLRKEGGGRLLVPAPTGEVQRRKELSAGRRARRAMPLLPVPPSVAAGRSRTTPAVEWPQGVILTGAEEWQDRPAALHVGQDFQPQPQPRAWDETAHALRRARSDGLKLCLFASVALHALLALSLISAPSPETVEIAGGGSVDVMLVGEQAFDSMAAGKPDTPETNTDVTQTEPIETAEVPQEATTSETILDPAEMDTATVDPVPEAQPVTAEEPADMAAAEPAELAPEAVQESAAAPENLAIDPSAVSETGELAPVPDEPVDVAETKPLDEVKPTEEIKPLPEPGKPEPKKTLAEKKPEAPKKPDKPKAEEKKVAARKKAEKTEDARKAPSRDNRGEAGEQQASAQRGVASNASRANSGDPGNAAVSNYPGKVAAKLRRALKYPKSAVSGSGGEAQVAFTVLSDGSATGIRVVSSSGSPVLDQAAVDAVRRAAPFPPIPDEAGRRQWPFAVPVLFRR